MISNRNKYDLRDELGKVDAPCVLVYGYDDFPVTPGAGLRLHLALSNSKLILIEDCGHFYWLEQPEVFDTLVPRALRALGLGAK